MRSLLDFPEVPFPTWAVLRERCRELPLPWRLSFVMPGVSSGDGGTGLGLSEGTAARAWLQQHSRSRWQGCPAGGQPCSAVWHCQHSGSGTRGAAPGPLLCLWQLSPWLREDFPECLQEMLIALASRGTAQPLGTKGS